MIKELDNLDKATYPTAIKLPCPSCERPEALSIGQVNFRGKLRWFESANCDQCGLGSEADGIGLPPSKIRELLIESDGEWCVILKNVKSSANVLKVLKAAFSIDMKSAIALLRAENNVLFRGTKSESLWLVELLETAKEFPLMEIVEENQRPVG